MQYNSLLTTVDINHISKSFVDNFNFVTNFSVLFSLLLIRALPDLPEEIIFRVEGDYVLVHSEASLHKSFPAVII